MHGTYIDYAREFMRRSDVLTLIRTHNHHGTAARFDSVRIIDMPMTGVITFFVDKCLEEICTARSEAGLSHPSSRAPGALC